MSHAPAVQAVLTNYNSGGTVLKAIEALFNQDHVIDKIVVVDNGSLEDAALIRQTYPAVCLIELGTNTGLTHARNVGLAQTNSEYVLVLDDDVYPARDCVGRLLAAAVDTGAALVCPRVVDYPGESTIQCDGASVHFAGVLIMENRQSPLAAVPAMLHACDGFIGACLLVKRQVLIDLGGFDEDYFFYFEDLELSLRLKALGYKIWCEPNAVSFHDRGSGTPDLSFRGSGAYPRRRAYYTLRNRWLTILLHYRFRTLLMLAPALGMYELGAFAECVYRGWLGVWLSAAWSLLINRHSILARRRKWQRARQLPDHGLFTGGPLPFAQGFAETGARARLVAVLGKVMNGYWLFVRQWI